MDFEQFKLHLHDIFEKNGLENLLDEDKVHKLYDFSNILIDTNKIMNLTAITDYEGIIFKHLADSAKLCTHIRENSSIIDVGCGAGFPSFPLAILRPDVKVTSLDSTAKKISFINDCAKVFSLDNISGVSARAEEFAEKNREKYDYATSRAVARLNILCELCIPLVKVGGYFVPLKAIKAQEELDESKNAIKALGAQLILTNEYKLTDGSESLERCIFEIKKCAQTNKQYPRKYAQILKKPL